MESFKDTSNSNLDQHTYLIKFYGKCDCSSGVLKLIFSVTNVSDYAKVSNMSLSGNIIWITGVKICINPKKIFLKDIITIEEANDYMSWYVFARLMVSNSLHLTRWQQYLITFSTEGLSNLGLKALTPSFYHLLQKVKELSDIVLTQFFPYQFTYMAVENFSANKNKWKNIV